MGTAAINSNSIFLSVVETLGIMANCPASVPESGLLAKTDSDVDASSTYPYTPTLSSNFGEFSASSALTWTHNPRIPFMAFSPGMGLSLGHGAAVYVGLTISILIGPTAFATPPLVLV